MERALRLLKLAQSVSESAEVLAVRQTSYGLRASPGGGISFEEASSTEENLRIVRNGRLGVGSSAGSQDLPSVVDMAIGGSRFGPVTEWRFPGPSEPGLVEMRHTAVTAMTLDDLTGLFLGIEDAVRSASPHAAATGILRRRDVEAFLTNSEGFEGGFSRALLEFEMELSFPGKDGMLVQALRFCSGLPPAAPGTLCADICTRHEWASRKADLPDGDMPVILSPPVLCTLLQSLRACVSGRALAAGATPLAGRVGQRVASPAVSVLDRPRLPYGGASAPFDAEGVPTTDRDLLRDGVFCGFVTDLATAHELGQVSTGSAGRNTGEHPSPVCTNLVFLPGEKSLEDLMKIPECCVYVAELLPGSSGDALSGNFAFEVPAGFLIRNGEVEGHLPGLSLSGNALGMLAGIREAGDSLHGVECDWLPAVLAEGALLRQSR
jgi:PmbA protein